MLFSKSTIAGALALVTTVLSQVVVTVTDTVTVVTITATVAPPTTSTSTLYTTITAQPPPPSSTPYTITQTVTTTVGTPNPAPAQCPIPYLGQCGGSTYSGYCAGRCARGLKCAYYSEFYSQCLYPGQTPSPTGAIAEIEFETVPIYVGLSD